MPTASRGSRSSTLPGAASVSRQLSGVLGVIFNGGNVDTDSRSGREPDLGLVCNQHLPEGYAVGLAGDDYQQLTAIRGGRPTCPSSYPPNDGIEVRGPTDE
jgi:hypothetical protein